MKSGGPTLEPGGIAGGCLFRGDAVGAEETMLTMTPILAALVDTGCVHQPLAALPSEAGPRA